jgi:hypothetical protein
MTPPAASRRANAARTQDPCRPYRRLTFMGLYLYHKKCPFYKGNDPRFTYLPRSRLAQAPPLHRKRSNGAGADRLMTNAEMRLYFSSVN